MNLLNQFLSTHIESGTIIRYMIWQTSTAQVSWYFCWRHQELNLALSHRVGLSLWVGVKKTASLVLRKLYLILTPMRFWLHYLVGYISHCFPLLFLPLIYLVNIKFSKPSFLMHLKNVSYLFLIISDNFFVVSILRISSLLIFVHIIGNFFQ